MIFRKSKKTVKRGASGMDKLITGVIIGWAAASIFGLSRTKKGKKVWQKVEQQGKVYGKLGLKNFGKCMVKAIEFLQNKK